jgi:N-ethylmaleimide reductase
MKGGDQAQTQDGEGSPLNDLAENDPHERYPPLLHALAPLNLAYLHIGHGGDEELLFTLRKLWPNTLLLNRAGTDIADYPTHAA